MAKIGVTLSGGASRGIVHLGILKALDEIGIPVSIISGTSSGAIIGALYAQGYPPDEILDIILTTKFFKLIRPAVSRTGLLKMDSTEKIFSKYLTEDDFSALKIKLIVATTDLCKGKTVYFSEGPLIKVLMASSCIPIVFDPVIIDNKPYIDGGILNNLPTEPLVGRCDKIIAAHCNPIDNCFEMRSFRSVFERTFLLIINSNTPISRGHCDVFIEPPGLKKISSLSLSRAKEMAEIGYQYTMNMAGQLQSLIF